MGNLRSRMLLVGSLLLFGSLELAAQTTYPSVRIAGRLQTQAYYFDNEDLQATTGPSSTFFIRRARIQANVQITETVYATVQPSFEDGSNRLRLRDAYVDVGFQRGEPRTRFILRMGQEKRPMNRYELLSSNNLPSLERGAGRGLIRASSNDLFLANGFLSHDMGAAVMVRHKMGESPNQALTFHAGVYNGEGESRNDVNDAKSFALRATAGFGAKLNVGASYASHDGITTPPTATAPDSSYKNTGFGVDAQWGMPGDEGLFLVGDFMTGESRADNDVTIQGISVVGAWHIRMQDPNAFLYAIEPALRFDTQDPDTDTDDDGSTLISAGVNLYLSSRAQIRILYENQSFQASGVNSISGVRSAFTVNF
jgi:Phosphate-selective porin O and P